MTQCQRLEAYLKQHGQIDPLESWLKLGIYRLGARIHDLKRAGLNIETQRKKVKNQFGECCSVALYVFKANKTC